MDRNLGAICGHFTHRYSLCGDGKFLILCVSGTQDRLGKLCVDS